ncbi:MAG: hypothetical protein HYZ37_17365 [Candidatus Solibacter usitatus]|nr:hypothetical protein [Candidatus Solibacter usitatus]
MNTRPRIALVAILLCLLVIVQAISAQSNVTPRLGKYNIYSYGATNRPPLFLGHVELMAGGKYRVSRTSKGPYYGEGVYEFDAASSAIQWRSGPYATAEWGGKFRVQDDTRHRIELRLRTIATNSQ